MLAACRPGSNEGARATSAGATDALTGGGASSSSTTVVKEEDPALSNRGRRAGHGSPALPRSGPREDEHQVPSVGGPVVPPKVAVAFPCPAFSTSGPRVERIASREQEGRAETSTVSEAGSYHQIDGYDETDMREVSAKSRADDVPFCSPPPMPFRPSSSLSIAVANPGLTYAAAVRKAAETFPASAVKGGCVTGKRSSDDQKPSPELPNIPSFHEDQEAKVRMEVIASVTTLGERLTFEEKCTALGIAPLSSGLCVATAAGPGGAIVPIGARPPVEEYARAVPFRSPMYHEDVKLAKKLQEEEYEQVAQAAARTHQDVERDAEFAASIDNELINEVTPLAPARPSADTQAELAYHPGIWSNRFAALADPSPADYAPLKSFPQKPRAGMIPKKPTLAEREYKQSKEETDTLRNQRDESARKGGEHLRVVEQQRVVRQAAQERLDAIRVERRKRYSEYNSAIAAIEKEILASDETSAEAERSVKLERQKTRETEDLLTRRRVEREQSCSSLLLEDDSRLPKATPEPYDSENPTLTVTLSRGPRAPTVGAVMGESGVNVSKFEAFQELRRLYPGSSLRHRRVLGS